VNVPRCSHSDCRSPRPHHQETGIRPATTSSGPRWPTSRLADRCPGRPAAVPTPRWRPQPGRPATGSCDLRSEQPPAGPRNNRTRSTTAAPESGDHRARPGPWIRTRSRGPATKPDQTTRNHPNSHGRRPGSRHARPEMPRSQRASRPSRRRSRPRRCAASAGHSDDCHPTGGRPGPVRRSDVRSTRIPATGIAACASPGNRSRRA